MLVLTVQVLVDGGKVLSEVVGWSVYVGKSACT